MTITNATHTKLAEAYNAAWTAWKNAAGTEQAPILWKEVEIAGAAFFDGVKGDEA